MKVFLRYPLTVILVISFLTILFIPLASSVKINSDVEVFFDRQSKNYKAFRRWEEQFGSDDILVIALRDNDIFTYENLTLLSEVTSRIEELKEVEEVRSLANVEDIIGKGRDFIIKPLMERVPSEERDLKSLRSYVLAQPLYVKRLISEEGDVAAVIVKLRQFQRTSPDYKKRVVLKIKRVLKELIPPSKRYYISGNYAIEFFYTWYMEKDLRLFLPLMLGIILIIVYFSFRDIIVSLLPIMVILMSLIFTMAIFYLLGFSINNISTIIPPIILAIAVADSIHLCVELRKKTSLNNINHINKSIENIAFPCFLTTITTAIGFFSLMISRIAPIRELGLVVGIGVFLAYFLTFSFLPAVWWKFNIKTRRAKLNLNSRYDKILESTLYQVEKLVRGKGKVVLTITFILITISFYGIKRIEVDTKIMDYFKKSSPIHKDTKFIEDNLSGVNFINIYLQAEKDNYFQEVAILSKIEDLIRFIYQLDKVDKVTSAIDYIKEINKSLHNEDSAYYHLPSKDSALVQYILLYGGEDLRDYVDSGWRLFTIRVSLKSYSSRELKAILNKLHHYIRTNFPRQLKVDIVGNPVLEEETNTLVTKGQLKSLILAMTIIFIIIFFVFKSFTLGLISIFPNLLPIIINFGIMGIGRININSATSMISAIAIGIIVDDTIHYLYSFVENYKKSGDYLYSIKEAIFQKGKPMLITTLILCLGFGVVMFSQFVPTFYFGFLSSLLILNALLADLIVLPVLILTFKPKV